MDKQGRKVDVFLAAPAGTVRDELADVLVGQGHRVLALGSQPPRLTLQGELQAVIRTADVVIGVVTGGDADANVYFELGIATGLGKPIVTVVADPELRVPIDLSENLVLRRDSSVQGWAMIAVDAAAFAASRTQRTPRTRASASEPRPLGLGAEADHFLAQLRHPLNDEQLENLVGQVFAACGVDVVSRSHKRDQGADFALWMDELNALTGNPILVEVKRVRRPQSDLELRAVAQLSTYMAQSGARFALLIVHDDAPLPVKTVGAGAGIITMVGLRELVNLLRERPLAVVLRDARNRAAHFGGDGG